ncbi:MAG: alanine racemase [Woeseiaceae bacterium]
MTFWPRARIRLDALQHNHQHLRQTAGGARLMAVIKANAYGHGLLTVAKNLPDADAFAVARLPDALRLADAGIRQPIVLFGGVYTAAELESALQHRLELGVHSERQVALLEAAGKGNAIVWLKLDTGMHRLGFEPAEATALIARLRHCRAVGEVRLMTHLANADDRGDDRTVRQVDRFRAVLETFDGQFSIANSAGLLGWPDSIDAGQARARSWVRCGIALYGISPFPGTCGADVGLQPVMEYESRLIGIKAIRAGDRVGYGGTWEAGDDTVIGIVAAGYGDGYPRFLPSGTPVSINGRRAALAGLVSMDLAAVDLGPGANDKMGDRVTLWGEDLPVETVAAHAGTIPYQLVCGVTQRDAGGVGD